MREDSVVLRGGDRTMANIASVQPRPPWRVTGLR
ncbi:putative HAMP domain-containing protein [Pseudomonas phage MR15]|uniref:Putative HAMP domain-containing protein n=1 Tax=Pseudomonas phage MR15 TaxID=2711179 RepID=A0A6M3TE07_9CAUD|nr:putative HAMP domain-containing protein [Pseudomonas phage MR15]QJD55108.1 putative HAMP domain-containing protein [Pseudomonas phage MR13]QJD55261.1 putative HAMP domain-containing protein [Pseudomonas phage MR15]